MSKTLEEKVAEIKAKPVPDRWRVGQKVDNGAEIIHIARRDMDSYLILAWWGKTVRSKSEDEWVEGKEFASWILWDNGTTEWGRYDDTLLEAVETFKERAKEYELSVD